MTKKQIVELVESVAPVALADEHDREKIGLQVGTLKGECTGVLTCLDVTADAVKKAIRNKCNLILSHHPMIYYPVGCIPTDEPEGEAIALAIKNDITVYSAHTNLDACEIGTNATLVRLFGGKVVKTNGCLFVAEIEKTTAGEFAKTVAKAISDNSVKLVGSPNKKIKKICVCSGGGASYANLDYAMKNADAYVVGDVSHHIYLYADSHDFPLVEYSHFSSEIIAEDIFASLVKETGIKTVKANQHRPFRTLEEI